MRFATAYLVLALSACAPDDATQIDGSTVEAFEASVEKARSELPIDDRLDFDRAISNVPGRSIADNEARILDRARETYDGMTAAEVVEAGRASAL